MTATSRSASWLRLWRRLRFFGYISSIGVLSHLLMPMAPHVMPFLLGNMAVSVLGQRLGLFWGLASAVLVMLPINSLPVQLFTLLQLVLVVALTRWRPLSLRQRLVWQVLLLIPVMVVIAQPQVEAPLLWIGGVLILLLGLVTTEIGARLIINVTDSGSSKPLPFESLLAQRITVASAAPLSLAVLLVLQQVIDRQIDNRLDALANEAGAMARATANHLTEHSRVIQTHAATLPLDQPDLFRSRLQVIGTHHFGFLTLLVADKNGNLLASWPESKFAGTGVSDRDYFRLPQQTLRPYQSEIFRGRGFGNDAIVAVSAPILDSQLQFAGLLEGSLNLTSLGDTLRRVADVRGVSFVIRDNREQVVYSTHPDFAALDDARSSPLLKLKPDRHAHAKVAGANIGFNASLVNLLAEQAVPLSGWHISTISNYLPLAHAFAGYTLAAIVLCLLMMAASQLFSLRFSHLVAAPLAELTQRVHAIDLDNADTLHAITVKTPVLELQQLAADFDQFINRLTGVHAELRLSLNLLDSLNQELEQRVQDRTMELVAARDQAQHLMQVKSAFLANMSHELRTPLTAIIGFARQALRDPSLSESSLDALNTIERNSQFLLEIIADILDATKLEFDKLELEQIEFSLLALVRDACKDIRPRADQKGISLRFAPAFPLPEVVCGDPVRVKQILLNLLSNAVKFTEQGSVEVTLGTDPDGVEWTVTIADSGIGIGAEQQQRLFQPFMQADQSTTRRFGGTGLGLFISKQLVMRMGGTLMLESREGVGSRFSVTLPVNVDPVRWLSAADRVPESMAPRLLPNLPPALRGRVLVAEDVEDLRRLVVAMVSRTGADVTAVENGAAARDAALEQRFDLILMDMHMPVLDGLSAVRQLRQQGYVGAIAALTADVLATDISDFLAAGCDEVLSKPVEESRLQELLQTHLAAAAGSERADTKVDNSSVTSEPASAGGSAPSSADTLQNLLKQLAEKFLARLPTDRATLQQQLESGDTTAAMTTLHRLKGSAGTFGFPAISAAAEALYRSLQNTDASPGDTASLGTAMFAEIDAALANAERR